jgi:hypothetical protein
VYNNEFQKCRIKLNSDVKIIFSLQRQDLLRKMDFAGFDPAVSMVVSLIVPLVKG